MASGRTTWQREQREEMGPCNAVSVNDVPLSLSEHNIYNDTSLITVLRIYLSAKCVIGVIF